MRREYRRQRKSSPSIIYIPTQPFSSNTATISTPQQSKRESRRLTWTNLALGAFIPLMIGVATVVITVRQQKLDDRRQNQERELDDRRHDLQQEQADELRYQDVFKTYIQDVSSALFKQQNQTMFADNRTRLAYIRSHTLTAMADLDWHRKSRLFLFLYDNNLLSHDQSLDLSGINFANITLESTSYKKLQFFNVSLSSVGFSNASFIGCEFFQSVDFTGSAMDDIKFTKSLFHCHAKYSSFNYATLRRADFRDSFLCDVTFRRTDLTYANFSRARFGGRIVIFGGTNLTFVDLSDTGLINLATTVIIHNTNMTGTSLSDKEFQEALNFGQIEMINVILPNGTWLIKEGNLIENGNAEENCSTIMQQEQNKIPGWISLNTMRYAISQNGTNENCYFNLTYVNQLISMFQIISLDDMTIFVDSSQAEYHFSVDMMGCEGALPIITLNFADETMFLLSKSEILINETNHLRWQTEMKSGKILVNTRYIKIEITRVLYKALCYVDNMELYIRRQNEE